jgi:thioesterase domain-containing protein/acyl carrier protein
LENKLVNIWETVLNVQPIGIHDNYFELGGHSLQTIALFAQIERAFQQYVPLAAIFQAPTIAQLAALLREKGETPNWSPLVPISPSGDKRPFFCVHGGAGHVYHFRSLARYLEPDQPFYGLQPRILNSLPGHYSNMKRIAHDYVSEIRQLQPEGPYYLGGFCFGGLVAFEMAQQLTQLGENVALVVIIDMESPPYRENTYQPELRARDAQPNRWQRHITKIKKQPGLLNKMAYVRTSGMGRLGRVKGAISSKWSHRRNIWNRLLIQWYWAIKRPLPLWLRNFQRLEVNRHIRKQYHPQIYSGDLTIIRSTTNNDDEPPDMGWGQLTAKSVHVYDIPGEHLKLLQEPHVRDLARHLQASLDATNHHKIEPIVQVEDTREELLVV